MWYDGPFIALEPAEMKARIVKWGRALNTVSEAFAMLEQVEAGEGGRVDEMKAKAAAKKLRRRWSIAVKHTMKPGELLTSSSRVEPARTVIDQAKLRLHQIDTKMHIITQLRSIGMRERHWGSSRARRASRCGPDGAMTLSWLLEHGVEAHQQAIELISKQAAQEYVLERSLDKMKADWNAVELECLPYKETGTYILRDMEGTLQMLDDHLIKTQAMRVSPYNTPFEERIQNWNGS